MICLRDITGDSEDESIPSIELIDQVVPKAESLSGLDFDLGLIRSRFIGEIIALLPIILNMLARRSFVIGVSGLQGIFGSKASRLWAYVSTYMFLSSGITAEL
eukprot:CAMPEP_0194293914 /NCGR_PEP_ID=MMETSP0169-20130528/48989_1 /TAXON_ID=218684 /ORGANISM="Corethron pennatum, Strain L29A3" /LENGTH=102 /DNA_ID=CAMNT_0039042587 /DNA_START=220 /DNA_END=528 /DNA_ORIENTATION=+